MKLNEPEVKTAQITVEPKAIFSIRLQSGVEMIRFEANGNIYIKGKKVTNDLEVVDGFRELILKMKMNPNS